MASPEDVDRIFYRKDDAKASPLFFILQDQPLSKNPWDKSLLEL